MQYDLANLSVEHMPILSTLNSPVSIKEIDEIIVNTSNEMNLKNFN